MVNNSKYLTPEVIAFELAQIHKNKDWDINTVRTWCMNCETRFIKDIGTMMMFQEIPLHIEHNGMALLPCNVFRILDIYEHNRQEPLIFDSNGAFAYNFKKRGQYRKFPHHHKLFITYVGINIDPDSGECLIVKGHEEACKMYCKLQMYEDDMLFNRFPKDVWFKWDEQFSGMFVAARSNYQHKSRIDIDNLSIIRGNMVPKIGNLILHHEQFK